MKQLFKYGVTELTHGTKSWFKIDCDCLTDEDIRDLCEYAFHAKIVERYSYDYCISIPRGGDRIQRYLNIYNNYKEDKHPKTILLVDDVWTTGETMNTWKSLFNKAYIVKGFVLFNRSPVDDWVESLFEFNDVLTRKI